VGLLELEILMLVLLDRAGLRKRASTSAWKESELRWCYVANVQFAFFFVF